MMTFNAAEREVCIVRKGHTNSPLQALTLMNNITFVETSRLMAERILSEGGSSCGSTKTIVQRRGNYWPSASFHAPRVMTRFSSLP
jgi:hypothetical protein